MLSTQPHFSQGKAAKHDIWDKSGLFLLTQNPFEIESSLKGNLASKRIISFLRDAPYNMAGKYANARFSPIYAYIVSLLPTRSIHIMF